MVVMMMMMKAVIELEYFHCVVHNKFPQFSFQTDSQDVELDAILGELSALESQFEKELGYKLGSKSSTQANNSGTKVITFTILHAPKVELTFIEYTFLY